MKLESKLTTPMGKGKIPTTEKQANQFAFYDELMASWKFPRPLTPALIEKLSIALTGIPRGIPINIWRESIAYCNERQDLTHPFGFLRADLARRLNK